MKRTPSIFFALILIFAWHLPKAVIATPHSKELSLELEDDGYALLDCQLVPIERKSKSTKRGPIHPHHLKCVEQHAVKFSSLNWSGFVAVAKENNQPNPTFASVTEVLGTWTIPKLAASIGGDTYSSAWVGIDGFANSVVEQIGTEHDVIDGFPEYYAWFEFYPANTQLIEGFPVEKGDKIEGLVRYKGKDASGNNRFLLALKNHTKKVKFAIFQSTLEGYPAHLSSAEWIVEAPAILLSDSCLGILPLANFGNIHFKNCRVTLNGKKGAIENNNWTFVTFSMISENGNAKAIPSTLISRCDGSGKKKCKRDAFNVSWRRKGPFPYEAVCD